MEQEHLEALIPQMRNRLIKNKKNNKSTIFFVVEDKNVYDKSILSILEEIREKQKK